MDNPKQKVLVVSSFGPGTPERSSGAFFFAYHAAKTGAEVSICFILQGPLLLKRGVAENLFAQPDGHPVRYFLDKALAIGVKFYVCDAALPLCGMTTEDLIEEVDNLVGPSFLIQQGLVADLVLNL